MPEIERLGDHIVRPARVIAANIQEVDGKSGLFLGERFRFRRVLSYIHAQEEAEQLVHLEEIAREWMTRVTTPAYRRAHPQLDRLLQPVKQVKEPKLEEDPTPTKDPQELFRTIAVAAFDSDPILLAHIRPLFGRARQDSEDDEDVIKAVDKIRTIEQGFEAVIGESLAHISTARDSGTFAYVHDRKGTMKFAALEQGLSRISSFFLNNPDVVFPDFINFRKALLRLYADPALNLDGLEYYRRALSTMEDIVLNLPEYRVHMARRYLQRQRTGRRIITPYIERQVQKIEAMSQDKGVAGVVMFGGIGSGKTTLGEILAEISGRSVGVISCHEYLSYTDLVGAEPVTVYQPNGEADNIQEKINRLKAISPDEWWRSMNDVVSGLKAKGTLSLHTTPEAFINDYCLTVGEKPLSTAEYFHKAHIRMLEMVLTAKDLDVDIGEKKEKLGIEGALVLGRVLNLWQHGKQPFLDELEKAGPRSLHGLYYLLGLRQGDTVMLGDYEFTIPSWAKIHASSNLRDLDTVKDHMRALFDRMKQITIASLPDADGLIPMVGVWIANEQGRLQLTKSEQAQLLYLVINSFPELAHAYSEGKLIQPFTLRGISEICAQLIDDNNGILQRTDMPLFEALALVLAAKFYLPADADGGANPLQQTVKTAYGIGKGRPQRAVRQPSTIGMVDQNERLEEYIAKLRSERYGANGTRIATFLHANRPIDILNDKQFRSTAHAILRRQDRDVVLQNLAEGPLYHAIGGSLDADSFSGGTPQVNIVDPAMVDMRIVEDIVKRNRGASGGPLLTSRFGTTVELRRDKSGNKFTLVYGVRYPAVDGQAGSMMEVASVNETKLPPIQIQPKEQLALIDMTPDGETIILSRTIGNVSTLFIVDSPFGFSPSVRDFQYDQFKKATLSPDGLTMYIHHGKTLLFFKRKNPSGQFNRVENQSLPSVESFILTHGGRVLSIDTGTTIEFYTADPPYDQLVQPVNKTPLVKNEQSELVPIGAHTVIEAVFDSKSSKFSRIGTIYSVSS